MKRQKTLPSGRGRKPVKRRHFSLEEANRALVLVGRIVADIVSRYTELLTVRDEFEGLARISTPDERLNPLRQRAEQLTGDLTRLHDELADIGCQLKDWKSGLVDFPAVREGREVVLCWKLGEPGISFWHDLDTGFAGRQPIGPDF